MNGGQGARSRRRWSAGALVLLLVALCGLGTTLSGPAWAADDVTFEVTLNERDIASADANDPLRLNPDEGVVLAVAVTNSGSTTVDVRTIKFDSTVLGLAFFSYATRVDLSVLPGETGTRTFALDLFDLGSQATGLLPAKVTLINPGRDTIAERSLTVDVRGDVYSVYGVFGVAIAAITLLLFFGLVVRLVSGRLPDHRWSRAWRFVLPGLGLGLTATLTSSVLRVVVPSPRTSLLLVAIGAAVGFVAGYLSPRPGVTGDEEALDERDLALDVVEQDDLGPSVVGLERSAAASPTGAEALNQPAASAVPASFQPSPPAEPSRATATGAPPPPPPPPEQ